MRECRVCGKEVISVYPTTVVCGDDCRVEYQERMQPVYRKTYFEKHGDRIRARQRERYRRKVWKLKIQ